MTVSRDGEGTIHLAGQCGPEDAEALLRHLAADAGAVVDWRECEAAHGAVIQVLMALRPGLIGPPADDFLQRHVAPLLL